MNYYSVISPIDALYKLKKGHNEFLKNTTKTLKVNLGQKNINALKRGQHPYATIITCSDSRICPNLIFNAGLSELFIIRTAGNTVDPLCIGSVEYSIEELRVPLIVVLGHEKCGAVKATLDSVKSGVYPNNFQNCIIKRIEPAVQKVLRKFNKHNQACCYNLKCNLENKCILENIKLTIRYLFDSDIVNKKLVENKLVIVGAKYNFNGNIDFKEIYIY